MPLSWQGYSASRLGYVARKAAGLSLVGRTSTLFSSLGRMDSSSQILVFDWSPLFMITPIFEITCAGRLFSPLFIYWFLVSRLWASSLRRQRFFIQLFQRNRFISYIFRCWVLSEDIEMSYAIESLVISILDELGRFLRRPCISV